MGEKKESVFQSMELIKKNWPSCWEKILPEVLMFFRIEEQLEKTVQCASEQCGIQRGDFDVLFRLRVGDKNRRQTPTEIYTSLGISSGGLTKILHRLEKKELVIRVKNPEDRRSTRVQLTLQGETVLCSVVDKLIASDQHFFSALSKEERLSLRQIFEKLISANL